MKLLDNLPVLDGETEITVHKEGRENQQMVLANLSGVKTISSEEDSRAAVTAVREARVLVGEVERARKDLKKPVLDVGRKIDAAAKDFNAPILADIKRVEALMAPYEEAKRQAAEAELQQKKDSLTVTATGSGTNSGDGDDDDFFGLKAHANEELREQIAASPPIPGATSGVRLKEDIEITGIDKRAIIEAGPDVALRFLKVEPRLLDIKSALKNGEKIPGITYKTITKSTITK